MGLWNPILTMEEHTALRGRLSDNRRTKGLRPARRNLLTDGILRCGLCGYHLLSMTRSTNHRRVYVCLKSVSSNGCNRISVAQEPIEALVIDRVFDRLGHESVVLCTVHGRPQPAYT